MNAAIRRSRLSVNRTSQLEAGGSEAPRLHLCNRQTFTNVLQVSRQPEVTSDGWDVTPTANGMKPSGPSRSETAASKPP
ncbi:hypothetical protein EYF80_053704 [Liparis tanakae]|uniref:Uncharacterized protein n=1 Tax=Liparis tanakae TaxID=230148 RepID=A0A4Z2F708_9TELE|nr:hypothetical protein EYF80_053704 [Liparis tanakae]